MDSFTLFNLLEGSFWIFIGIASVVLFWFIPKNYQRLSFSAGIILIVFGISDFVEICTGGFLPGPLWLLTWKTANVLGLIGIIVWYLKLRLKV